MPIEDDDDKIRPVMDSVQPFVANRDFTHAAQLVRKAVVEALDEGRREDAATLSSILASFLTVSGDYASALQAFEQAEILEPTNLHHALATARHMLTKLGDVDAAEAKVIDVLASAGNDHHLAHNAASTLGQCSLAKGNLDKALSELRHAQSAAIEGDIHPGAWDFFLIEEIARIEPGNETCRSYAEKLLSRALARSHAVSEKRARAFLRKFGE
jgi:tetratricopeptide (TPR) repeat protein